MSWQTDITQAVANLTNRLNQITTSAKKIFELPWQNILNPASKVHVSNPENESEFITVQQILDAALSYRQNQLIEATISVDGNDVTVDDGAQWIINNINYELAADFVETVDYAETGYTRNDILVGDEANLIYRIIGPETEGISPTPNVPLNTVLVTTINVTDSTIGYIPPVVLDITTDDVLNNSDVDGETASDALDYLNINKEDKINKGIPNGYASLGPDGFTLMSEMNPSVIERLVVVADQTARFALTTATVQNGDTVKQLDVEIMYYVKDDTNLSNSNGYELYRAGTASSVPWTGVTGTPNSISGYGIIPASGDYNTGLVTEVANKNYQTDNQKLFNDATSSIQTQLNSKALDSNVIHVSGNETKQGILTTYGNKITDLTYTYNESLKAIRNNFSSFYNQPFFESDYGYYTFRPSTNDTPSRFYIMPNGTTALTPVGVTSKFEMFNSDYSANYTTYNGFNIVLDNTNNAINIGPDRGFSGGTRMKMRLGGDYSGSQFFDNASNIDFETDNSITINRFVGGVSFGIGSVDPFALSVPNQYTFRNPQLGQTTRVNVIGNTVGGGIYYGRDAIRSAVSRVDMATSDYVIGTNATNTGTTLTDNFRIYGATGHVRIQNGGTFTDGAALLQVAGSISATTYSGDATLTGNPTAPTPTAGDNSTKIATTAFVTGAIATAKPYKIYTAILNQTGTADPVATVLENTTGATVVWTRASVGQYLGTFSSGVLTLNKTIISPVQALPPYTNHADTYRPDLSTVRIITTSSAANTDGLLNSSYSYVEIRVYP